MSYKTLQDLIESKVALGKQSATGYRVVKCPCCSDYKYRGGWRFSATEIAYSCFNCSTVAVYNAVEGKISRKLRGVLKDFGITDEDIAGVIGQNFFNRVEAPTISLESLHKVNLYTPEIALPSNSVKVTSPDCPTRVRDGIQEYLQSRKLSIESYPFYYSSEKDFKHRFIIPYFKQNKIVYWQARSLVDTDKLRYLNCSSPKNAIIFNYDELFLSYNSPLFVCEGVFDALHLNGIGLLGSTLCDEKLEILRKTRRPLIFVIDQDPKGKTLAYKIMQEKLGSITFAERGKDVNKSIQDSGKLWAVHTILNNTLNYDDKQLPLKVDLMCKK